MKLFICLLFYFNGQEQLSNEDKMRNIFGYKYFNQVYIVFVYIFCD